MKKLWILVPVLIMLLTGCAGETKEQAEKETTTETVTDNSQSTETLADDSGYDDEYAEIVAQQVAELKESEEKNRENKEVVYIEEKIYLSQMTDVYMNTSDYVGRTISLEGYMLLDGVEGDIKGAVVRNTPGCCGDDGLTGFHYAWDGDAPAENEWLRVTGVLTARAEGSNMYMVIEADEVEVLAERGQEFVSQ